jgi:GDP-L-fucose synthase
VLTNLYGPGDNYDLEDSHVVAAMVRKYAEAVERGDDRVVLWGTGTPTRELLYVDDAARALLLAAERYDSSEPFNVSTGEEISIRKLAVTVAQAAGFDGETVWDSSRPDGAARRCLDVTRARQRLGFAPEVTLEEGLRRTIESFRATRTAQPA